MLTHHMWGSGKQEERRTKRHFVVRKFTNFAEDPLLKQLGIIYHLLNVFLLPFFVFLKGCQLNMHVVF